MRGTRGTLVCKASPRVLHVQVRDCTRTKAPLFHFMQQDSKWRSWPWPNNQICEIDFELSGRIFLAHLRVSSSSILRVTSYYLTWNFLHSFLPRSNVLICMQIFLLCLKFESEPSNQLKLQAVSAAAATMIENAAGKGYGILQCRKVEWCRPAKTNLYLIILLSPWTWCDDLI